MNSKVIQALIICAVAVAAFLALYLQKPPVAPIRTPAPGHHAPEIEKIKEVHPVTFTLPIDSKKSSYFGILGEGRGNDFADDPVNSTVLKQLFETLKARQVDAIFFTGNLVSGVEKGMNGRAKPIPNNVLQEELRQFSGLYEGIFEHKVPFFPALGDREILIPEGPESFIKEFHLQGAKIIGDELLYTVSAGNALFAVIATDEFLDGVKGAEENFSMVMLDWLDSVLKEGAKTHKYLFVVGYEPAYPSTATFSKKHLPERDAFWKILVDNHVLAYFSSKEHLFDRSNRSGVWQVISGGGGAPLSQGGGSKPFYHSLVLTIPGDQEVDEKGKLKVPGIQVIDNSGNMIEEFFMSPENQPLYQMRIS